jgi:CheY-like chemotaxis protein
MGIMTTPSPLLSAPGEVSNMRRMRPTRERVLVVEDQPQLLELTGLMLETAGLTVMRAANASECLGILECETPDLILLDINLPDLCGFDLCHQIKDNPRYAGVAVVHLSGSSHFE